MNTVLIDHYQAIERASQDMLEAARNGDWQHVLQLEGACALLVSQLKLTLAASARALGPGEARAKSRIMRRILINDAEIRDLAAPRSKAPGGLPAGNAATLH